MFKKSVSVNENFNIQEALHYLYTKRNQTNSLILTLGAKSDGAGGFFKGIGKGLIGVVARPAGGVVDLASNTFDGLKRFVVV